MGGRRKDDRKVVVATFVVSAEDALAALAQLRRWYDSESDLEMDGARLEVREITPEESVDFSRMEDRL